MADLAASWRDRQIRTSASNTVRTSILPALQRTLERELSIAIARVAQHQDQEAPSLFHQLGCRLVEDAIRTLVRLVPGSLP